MKNKLSVFFYFFSSLIVLTSCTNRHIRTAVDITPGNPAQKLGWQYGAYDIRIQTTKINKQLMDRWFSATGYNFSCGKPRIIITDVDNGTDQYIPLDMIRDIIEGVAIDDGRYSIIVGNYQDERELDAVMHNIQCNPKYANETRLRPNLAKAPEFLAKIRLTKSVTRLKSANIEAYRMQVTLYDIQTQEAIDSAWDVLEKRVS